MGRYSGNNVSGHKLRRLGEDCWRISWVIDRYYPTSNLRHPTGYSRVTYSEGSEKEMDQIFTPQQVENLAHNQTAGAFHPFTCPNRSDGAHAMAYGDLGALVATTRGWICPFCDYTQDWAHGFMTEGKMQMPLPTPPDTRASLVDDP